MDPIEELVGVPDLRRVYPKLLEKGERVIHLGSLYNFSVFQSVDHDGCSFNLISCRFNTLMLSFV